jgi:hypothetical protein
MADIAFRALTSGDLLGVQNFTITKPAGTVSTDIILLMAGFAGGTTVTAPTGWTVINNAIGDATVRGGIWWALGSNTNLTFTHPSTSDLGWTCAAYQNCDTSNPIDAVGSTNTNINSATIPANAVTTVTDRSLEIIGCTAWQSGAWSATSFTSRDNGSAANQQAAIIEANAVKTPAGSTGVITVNNGGAASGQHLISIPFALRGLAIPSLELEGYRIRKNDGDQATATWFAAQDTPATVVIDTAFRVRTIINATNDPNSEQYQYEYKKSTDSTWRKVDR